MRSHLVQTKTSTFRRMMYTCNNVLCHHCCVYAVRMFALSSSKGMLPQVTQISANIVITQISANIARLLYVTRQPSVAASAVTIATSSLLPPLSHYLNPASLPSSLTTQQRQVTAAPARPPQRKINMALIPSQILRVAILLSYLSIICNYKAIDMPAHQTYGGSWKFLTFIDLVSVPPNPANVYLFGTHL